MDRSRALLAFVLGFVCLLPRIAAQSAESGLTGSPLRQGVLPNGLHFAVLPHPSPKGDISLRLIVHAGSLDEHDDERGFAHFVEHMAFDDTLRHPAGSVRNFFQHLGLTFGPDLNANTSYTHTTYLLDLPNGRADQLDEALSVLRDYADGLLFPPDQVTREAGVVISEFNSRDSAARRNGLQMINLLYAGTRLPDREVGGVPAQLEHASPDQLRAFYRRNYLPDRMTVLIVGPIEPAAIIDKITAAFSSMTRFTDGVAPAPFADLPSFAGVRPDVVVVPTAKGSTVELTAITPRPADTLEGHRQELVQRVVTAALDTRLRERRERQNVTQFGQVRAGYDVSPVSSLVQHMLGVPTTANGWPDAVIMAETELRRARTAGFVQVEIDEAVADQLTALRNRIAEAASQPAARIATDLARFVATGRTWQTPEADLSEGTRELQGLTAAEATTALQEVFPADSLHLILIVAPDNKIKSDRLLAAFNKSAGLALAKNPASADELHFRYGDFGRPGQVAKREHVDDLDLTLVSFANGVRLNVRPSTLEPGRFRLRVVFPLNYSNVPYNRGGLAELAGQLLLSNDFGKQKQTELARLIKLRGLATRFVVNNGTPVLELDGPGAELPFALHFLNAMLSDLKFDTDSARVAMSRYAGEHHNLVINPGPLALRVALRLFANNDSRLTLNPPQYFARFTIDETEAWLYDHILAGPLEIGIVGDFAADDVVTMAAASVGTLKRRHAAPKAGAPLRMATKPTWNDATLELPASVAVSCVFWPVQTPDDPHHDAALTLATDVLRDRLLVVLREALGLTYTPDARLHRDSVQRDFAFAAMVNTFDPARAAKLTEGSVRLAEHLAQKGVNDEEFARLREPARARSAADLRNNGWWLNTVVSLAQSRPEVLDYARHHANIFDDVTITDVNEAAEVFSTDKITILVLRPAPANSVGDGKAPNSAAAPKK
jgi:zinc protease